MLTLKSEQAASGLSNLKSWVGALSRFGDSHGFYWQPWLSANGTYFTCEADQFND